MRVHTHPHSHTQVLLSSFLSDACSPFLTLGGGAYDCVRVHVELLGCDGSDAVVAVQVGRGGGGGDM